MNMLATIIPKSDQLNSDDLIGRTMTITITRVQLDTASEQPVSLHFEGDGGKPYKACKSMRRVLVNVWGPDGNEYVGRSMTIYRDPEVMFGGMKVGGIRISHMSHIDKPVTMALTATRANKKPFTVKPLAVEQPPKRPTLMPETAQQDSPAERAAKWASDHMRRWRDCMTADEYNAIQQARGFARGWQQLEAEHPDLFAVADKVRQETLDRLADAESVEEVGAAGEP